MTGFWQSLGTTKICVVDGIYGSQTVAYTKRLQVDLAEPDVPQTGVVNTATWNAIEGSVDGFNFPRLKRLTGSTPSKSNGFFAYYNGESTEAQLYWQGLNTGTGLWKFKPAGAPDYFMATTSRTMGSYPTGGFGC